MLNSRLAADVGLLASQKGHNASFDPWQRWRSLHCCRLDPVVVKGVDIPADPLGLTVTWWGFRGLCQRNKPTELARSFLFCSCAYLCLYGSFSCVSIDKVPPQLSALSLCSFGPNSALLVLSTRSLYESLPQPWYNPLWLTGLKASTNPPAESA